jgi:anaerobic magnesium-protoporphyrin IX monomethyl ester cyclase
MPPWLGVYGNYKEAAKLGCIAPPLGLAYLGAAVEAGGDECRIVDMQIEKVDVTALLETIKEYGPGFIGITATTPIFQNAALIARAVKERFPDITVGIGGVHATIFSGSLLDECEYFDVQIVGEGELTLQEVIRSLKGEGPPFEEIPGLVFRRDGKIIRNSKRHLTEDLDDLPLPARHLLRNDLYCHAVPGKESVSYANIFTSRGCPFECVFCSQHTMFGRRMRWHSVGRVIEECRTITQDFGIGHIIFMDETLTLNRPRLKDICRAIYDSGMKFTWEGWTHASTVDQEILEIMKSAGLIRISFGIESGDAGILRDIKKGVSLDDIKKAYKMAHKAGIETRGSAMLGHPNETLKTAWRTIRFCRSIKECQQIFLNVVCPYPGTELYEIAKNGTHGMKLLSSDYSQYKRYGDPVISVNGLGPQTLKRLQAFGLVYFYLVPHRIWYNIFRRAGIRAGMTNAFAFLKGIIRGLFLGGTAADLEKHGVPGEESGLSEGSMWDGFWAKRQGSFPGGIISWCRRRFITSALAGYLLKNTGKGTLIEAGCGSGEVTLKVAKRRGDAAVLVDISNAALSRAKLLAQAYGIEADLVNCDIARLSLNIRKSAENIVYNIGVIEHFRDPSEILREMAKTSGPYALAIVPGRSVFWSLFYRASKAMKLVPEDFFVIFYDKKQLSSMVSSAGLEVLWLRTIRILGFIPYIGVCFRSASSDGRHKDPEGRVFGI